MNFFDFDMAEENQKEYLVLSCEGRFEDMLDDTVEVVLGEEGLRFVTITGHSCSGKTTTSNKLVSGFVSAGKRVKVISVDDFYIEKRILEERCVAAGIPLDMDSASSINLAELGRFIGDMIDGKPSNQLSYDFIEQKSSVGELVNPDDYDVFIFEGIQTIYPEVRALFKDSRVYRILVSVAEGIDTPWGFWTPSEMRLIRRIVRDARTRNTSAEQTFENWSGVVRNEKMNINPYIGSEDAMINSAMLYELCVLKPYVCALTEKMDETDDHYILGRMIKEKISRFPDISPEYVPDESVLREFIGARNE